MDAKAKAAFSAYDKAQKLAVAWARDVAAGRAYYDKAKGRRLGEEVQRKYRAFLKAGEPFARRKRLS